FSVRRVSPCSSRYGPQNGYVHDSRSLPEPDRMAHLAPRAALVRLDQATEEAASRRDAEKPLLIKLKEGSDMHPPGLSGRGFSRLDTLVASLAARGRSGVDFDG